MVRRRLERQRERARPTSWPPSSPRTSTRGCRTGPTPPSSTRRRTAVCPATRARCCSTARISSRRDRVEAAARAREQLDERHRDLGVRIELTRPMAAVQLRPRRRRPSTRPHERHDRGSRGRAGRPRRPAARRRRRDRRRHHARRSPTSISSTSSLRALDLVGCDRAGEAASSADGQRAVIQLVAITDDRSAPRPAAARRALRRARGDLRAGQRGEARAPRRCGARGGRRVVDGDA